MTVEPAAVICAVPLTSQSPAVKVILVTFAAMFVVSAIPVATAFAYSPTLPACALSAAAVPLMPIVVDGVISPVAVRAAAVAVPVNVGDANGAYVDAALAVVKYPATDAPPGIVTVPVNVGEASGAAPMRDNSAGAVVTPVPPFTTGVMPVKAAAETLPQPAVLVGPLDTMACPAVDPAVLRRETGLGVVAIAATAISAANAPIKSRFIVSRLADECTDGVVVDEFCRAERATA